jgi:hypothetical protein
MDKMKIQEIADQVADDMGYDFGDLTPKMQIKVYNIAMDQYQDMLADAADMSRKNEASGGMMRANYAKGSEDDIPEQEDIPMEEFDDIKKMLNVPMDQASGIMSIDNKMASEPSRKADADSIARELFGKGIDELDEVEIIQLQEYLDRLASKRKAPSIKMAEGYEPGNYDPLIVDEYEKYRFDAEEQGQPVMSIDEFLQMARSQAMNGGVMRQNYADKGIVEPPRSMRMDTTTGEGANIFPIKKDGDKIDLDVEKIKQLIDQRKKEKKKLAKGGIAGVL